MKPTDIKYIVVHCSATRSNQDIGYKEINQMHVDRGWSGIGYHIVIRRDGTIELGRPLDFAGAHAYGYNRVSYGVCLVGGLDKDGNTQENGFNPEQLQSLERVVRGLKLRAPQAEVLGHRDLSPDVNGDGVIESWEWKKQCPCMDAREWWAKAVQLRGAA